MKLRVPFSTIFLATGLLPSQAMRQSEPLFNAQSSEDSLARSKGRDEPPSADSTYKSGGNWLFNESEYFPFDADSFEER